MIILVTIISGSSDFYVIFHNIDSNNLDASLVKAGANVALGRMQDAYRATKEVLRINSRFSLEAFAKTQPYEEPQSLERMIAMLRTAGLT